MQIKILGSGTILSNQRNPSGYLIEHKNHLALLDCGPGILRRLIHLNVDVLSLSAIFLSHFHVDHYSDVLAVLMRRYLKNRQINKNLTIFGPRGLKFWYDVQAKLHGNWLNDNRPALKEMYKNEETWADLKITSFPTMHLDNSIACKFQQEKRRFFYSSDTDFDDDLVAFSKGSDLAVLECSHRDENPQKGHLTPRKAAAFINRARFNKTVITHIYPENDTEDLCDRIKKFTDYDVEIAFDYMDLRI